MGSSLCILGSNTLQLLLGQPNLGWLGTCTLNAIHTMGTWLLFQFQEKGLFQNKLSTVQYCHCHLTSPYETCSYFCKVNYRKILVWVCFFFTLMFLWLSTYCISQSGKLLNTHLHCKHASNILANPILAHNACGWPALHMASEVISVSDGNNGSVTPSLSCFHFKGLYD